MLPKPYAWLGKEPGPKMLMQMVALCGTVEFSGAADNPVILTWADECGISGYKHDAIPWCGLTVAIAAKRAGWDYAPGHNALWARNWALWGTDALKARSVPQAALGDVLVFPRGDSGHVTLYVGEDATHYHCLGGNQSDAVSIVRKPKRPILAIRRAPWRISQPVNVRPIRLAAGGTPASTKEN
jgi:uncharacterized protein (TIGR02594 family)